MQFTESAVILSTSKYGENSAIATLFTSGKGIYKGMVRGITGAKQRGIYQQGNIVSASWRGRLEDHLGNFSCEPDESIAAFFINDSKRLAALSSVCSLIEKTLPERDPHPTLFDKFKEFLINLKNDSLWELHYVLLELELLSELGFRLELWQCAATGITEDLLYVSPKSGKAVSRDAGERYKDRLLKLPNFLGSRNISNICGREISNGLVLSGYFLNKYIFEPHGYKMPPARLRFVELMS